MTGTFGNNFSNNWSYPFAAGTQVLLTAGYHPEFGYRLEVLHEELNYPLEILFSYKEIVEIINFKISVILRRLEELNLNPSFLLVENEETDLAYEILVTKTIEEINVASMVEVELSEQATLYPVLNANKQKVLEYLILSELLDEL